jgi:glycine hydroxymethyltransferase
MTRLSPTADRDRYRVDKSTGWIDYDHLAETAAVFKPRLIICGASAYSRDFDYKRFREIADECGAYLHCDMAHISGLVAAGAVKSPFEYVVAQPSHSLHAAVSVR